MESSEPGMFLNYDTSLKYLNIFLFILVNVYCKQKMEHLVYNLFIMKT